MSQPDPILLDSGELLVPTVDGKMQRIGVDDPSYQGKLFQVQKAHQRTQRKTVANGVHIGIWLFLAYFAAVVLAIAAALALIALSDGDMHISL